MIRDNFVELLSSQASPNVHARVYLTRRHNERGSYVRQQSRLFARWNQSVQHSPNSNRLLLRLSAMISRWFICADSDPAMIRAHLARTLPRRT
jgi:hypothetical protein